MLSFSLLKLSMHGLIIYYSKEYLESAAAF